jgi:hypothetical protein
MATTKPRFTITLSPYAYAVLEQVCTRRKKSKAAVISSLIKLLVDDEELAARSEYFDQLANIDRLTVTQKQTLRALLDKQHVETLSRMGL